MRRIAVAMILATISPHAFAQQGLWEQLQQRLQGGPAATPDIDLSRADDSPGAVYTKRGPRLTIGDLRKGHTSVFKTDVPFKSIDIGDPAIVDVTASSDRTVSVHGLAKGSTNVLFLDENGEVITELRLSVDLPRRRPATANAAPGTLIRIHNKGHVTSFTVYQCGPDYCDYKGEMTSKEQPPPVTRTETTETRNVDIRSNGAQSPP
jgi:hypothetical protein